MSASMAEVLKAHRVIRLVVLQTNYCETCGALEDGDQENHQAEQLAANGYGKLEDAWDEGFDRGFYDPLAGSDRDASESGAKNPYRRPE